MTESFMSICPRSKQYTGYNITGIPLTVIQSGGVEITPHIKFTENELDKGALHFHNNSSNSDKFSIKCLINAEDTVDLLREYDPTLPTDESNFIVMNSNGDFTQLGKHEKVIDVLDYFIRNGEPFYVTTRAIGIEPKQLWLVTENKSRKQKYDDKYVEWDLTFTKQISYTYAKFQNTNTSVKKAMKKYKNKKEKAKLKNKNQSKLKKKCKVSQLKYHKKKKVVSCVKVMQNILYSKGCLKKKNIDGWYGKTTKSAVKKFQKKYAKKYKLKKTGKVDKATFKALYSV